MQRIYLQVDKELMKLKLEIVEKKGEGYAFNKYKFMDDKIRQPILDELKKIYREGDKDYESVFYSSLFFVTQNNDDLWELLANVNDAIVNAKISTNTISKTFNYFRRTELRPLDLEASVDIFFNIKEDKLSLLIIDNGPGLGAFFKTNEYARVLAGRNEGFVDIGELVEGQLSVFSSKDMLKKNKKIAGGKAKATYTINEFLKSTGGGVIEICNVSDLRKSKNKQQLYGLSSEDMKKLPKWGTAVMMRSSRFDPSILEKINHLKFIKGTRQCHYRNFLIENLVDSEKEKDIELERKGSVTSSETLKETSPKLFVRDLGQNIEMIDQKREVTKSEELTIDVIEKTSESLETVEPISLIDEPEAIRPTLRKLSLDGIEMVIETPGLLNTQQKEKFNALLDEINRELDRDSCCVSIFSNRALKLKEKNVIERILEMDCGDAIEFPPEWVHFRASLKSLIRPILQDIRPISSSPLFGTTSSPSSSS